MGQGQHEIFMEGVKHPEGELVVVEFAVDGVLGHVLQGVVHPSHVPLHAEAQSAHVGGPGDHGPGGGFLGDGLHIGKALVDLLVELAQKVNRLQVFPAAVLVGNPFALPCGE